MLKFLIILFSVIYLGGMIIRWFFRKWVTNISQQTSQRSQPTKKEGEVTIDPGASDRQSKNNGEGEYVDYEEVK